ncbi:hypothetical protein, partial [Evtepia sp.]|uniref:hypothetical protein n=1 Tax=Evtepia sp. TaxID=2773933 RepID=UPI003F17E64E
LENPVARYAATGFLDRLKAGLLTGLTNIAYQMPGRVVNVLTPGEGKICVLFSFGCVILYKIRTCGIGKTVLYYRHTRKD